MLKAAIFDFDGTLFDSNYIWETAGEHFFQSIRITPKSNLQHAIRTMSLYQSACYIREEYGLSLSVEEIMEGINRSVENCYFHEVMPKNGVCIFLQQLQKLCDCYLTNFGQSETFWKFASA